MNLLLIGILNQSVGDASPLLSGLMKQGHPMRDNSLWVWIPVLVLIGVTVFIALYEPKKKTSQIDKVPPQTTGGITATETKEDILFRRIETLMLAERLFLEPVMSRKIVASRLNTNEIYVAQAIRKCKDLTFSEYLNGLRLEFARNLQLEHPEKTLDMIAEESGFMSRSTFFRLFKKQYGVSPRELKRQHSASGQNDSSGN